VVPLLAFVAFANMVPTIANGGTISIAWEWVPALDIRLSFFADGLSVLFLLIISGIGTFVTWYAGGYLHGKKDLGRFYLYLLGFMGAMLGIVISDSLVLLFVFWELTSITSYLLIGYYCEKEASRKAALQALLVTGGGGLAMLAGILLLGHVAGTYEISKLLAMPQGELAAHAVFPAILILLLLGAFTKSAQFPFYFWLPNAMEAPAPVSSYLHSATMVKAGVFLLARLHPCLSPSPLWTSIVAPIGAITMLIGVFLALGQSDTKRILAYTTVAVLGTLTMLLGLGTELAVKSCMAYLLAHALYKAALFMAAGSVDHATGTRDVGKLGGLFRLMPMTAAAAFLGALSMAGLPFLVGFVSKEYFYKALLDAPGPRGLWETLGVSASVGMVALAATAGLKPFFGKLRPTPHAPHEMPWTMWIGPLLLGILAIKFGLFPGWIGTHLLGPAAASVLGDPTFTANLKLWHGWTMALALSGLTVFLGVGLYYLAPRIRARQRFFETLKSIGPERVYDLLLAGVLRFAALQTHALQSGRLRNYVLIVGGFTALLVFWLLPRSPMTIDWNSMATPGVLGITICAVMIAAAVMACMEKSRFSAILALGVVGFGVAVIYFLYGAPDLAMTQILVETLTLVLFVMAFQKLPLLKQYSSRSTKIRDAVLAGGFGVMMTCLVLAALHYQQTRPPISQYMGENSLPLANGRNVVNVILVDFRALDTLGEITVLAVAALGVFAMLKLRPKPEGSAKGIDQKTEDPA
jgi:multicomponent Na+:H+ antiporter subunit A